MKALKEGRMEGRGVRKKMTGIVIGTKMEKTAMVMVSRLKKHKTYGKYVRDQAKYMAHDPKNRCHEGDRVRIIESRPISKRKRWQVLEILETAVAENVEQVE